MSMICPNGHVPEGDERYCQQCGSLIDRGVVQEAEHEPAPMSADNMPTALVRPAPSAPPAGGAVPPGHGQPSIAPTLIVSLLCGLVGLWPAIRHSHMAKQRGLPAGRYWWAFGVPLFASVVVSVAVIVALGAGRSTPTVAIAPVPVSVPVITTTTTAPTTTTTTTTTLSSPPTSSIAQTAELQTWANDPQKCGPVPTPQPTPVSADDQYHVTATIHVWSAPSIASTPLGEITVTQYGPGGIGCPTDSQPTVEVSCKTTGDTITGPFGPDAVWEQIQWNGSTVYVPDEWVDTQWDVNSFASC